MNNLNETTTKRRKEKKRIYIKKKKGKCPSFTFIGATKQKIEKAKEKDKKF
jgi:hypothetical protein